MVFTEVLNILEDDNIYLPRPATVLSMPHLSLGVAVVPEFSLHLPRYSVTQHEAALDLACHLVFEPRFILRRTFNPLNRSKQDWTSYTTSFPIT